MPPKEKRKAADGRVDKGKKGKGKAAEVGEKVSHRIITR